jgi:hypothetical protein
MVSEFILSDEAQIHLVLISTFFGTFSLAFFPFNQAPCLVVLVLLS